MKSCFWSVPVVCFYVMFWTESDSVWHYLSLLCPFKTLLRFQGGESSVNNTLYRYAFLVVPWWYLSCLRASLFLQACAFSWKFPCPKSCHSPPVHQIFLVSLPPLCLPAHLSLIPSSSHTCPSSTLYKLATFPFAIVYGVFLSWCSSHSNLPVVHYTCVFHRRPASALLDLFARSDWLQVGGGVVRQRLWSWLILKNINVDQ